MKKTFKRAGVAVLSMAMLLSMGAIGATSVSAAGEQTVTAPSTVPGATYKIYKIATSTLNDGQYVYRTDSIESPFTDVLTTDNTTLSWVSTDANSITADTELWKVETNSAQAKELARELEAKITTATTATETLNSGATANLAPGYYIALTSGVTGTVAPILFDVKAAPVPLTAKASPVTLDKGILTSTGVTLGTEGISGSYTHGATNAAAAVGTDINFKIVTDIPNYATGVTAANLETDYVITDTPTNLDITESTVTVGIDSNNDGTVDVTTLEKGNDKDYQVEIDGSTGAMTITLSKAKVIDYQGGRVVVTYTAKLNQNAAQSTNNSDEANSNTAKLNFDNNYEGGGAGLTDADKPSDTNNVYTAKLSISKTFSDSPSSPYPEAVLTLKKGDDIVGTLNTKTENVLTKEFTGLTAGSYSLEETTIPDGYQGATTKNFSISANPDNGSSVSEYVFTYTGFTSGTDVTLNNVKKDTLPGTGGIGTTLFTVGGAAVVLFAGFMFVVYMKKRKIEE